MTESIAIRCNENQQAADPTAVTSQEGTYRRGETVPTNLPSVSPLAKCWITAFEGRGTGNRHVFTVLANLLKPCGVGGKSQSDDLKRSRYSVGRFAAFVGRRPSAAILAFVAAARLR
jgi:hypothetical protein